MKDLEMPDPQRKQKIIDLLSAKSFYRINELTEVLGTSISTIRRELNTLEAEGIVKRSHGGVTFLGEKKALPIFLDRQATMAKEKAAIGKQAAKLVEDGDSVIIDGGTTPYQVALNLQNKNIQVVTNSLPVANLFANSHTVQLISTGGTLYPATGVYLGPYANNTLKNIRTQKAFIGVAGITTEGLYNSNALVVETERAIIQAAAHVYVVADQTKFGRQDLACLCDFSSIAGIITTCIPDENRKIKTLLDKNNVKIIFA